MSEVMLFSVVVAAIVTAKALNVLVFDPLLYKLRSNVNGNSSAHSGAKHELAAGRAKKVMTSDNGS